MSQPLQAWMLFKMPLENGSVSLYVRRLRAAIGLTIRYSVGAVSYL